MGTSVYTQTMIVVKVNAFHAGKSYIDARAAKNINGTKKMTDLDKDPFLKFVEYGNNDGKQGY
eukprot:12864563-Ditylum_brightwellii.AAC.2